MLDLLVAVTHALVLHKKLQMCNFFNNLIFNDYANSRADFTCLYSILEQCDEHLLDSPTISNQVKLSVGLVIKL